MFTSQCYILKLPPTNGKDRLIAIIRLLLEWWSGGYLQGNKWRKRFLTNPQHFYSSLLPAGILKIYALNFNSVYIQKWTCGGCMQGYNIKTLISPPPFLADGSFNFNQKNLEMGFQWGVHLPDNTRECRSLRYYCYFKHIQGV